MTAEQYFEGIAAEVFAQTLRDLGAELVESSELVVRFGSKDWFVDLFVLPEDGPRYSPRVAIGPLPELGVQPQDREIDILHTLPEDSPLRRYNLEWPYSNPSEMRTVFIKVRDEIFKPYAQSVLLDRERLTHMVVSRSAEVYRQWQEEIAAHNDSVYRAKAQASMSAKDFGGFLAHMAKIPVERQTALDQAKLRYAQKKLR